MPGGCVLVPGKGLPAACMSTRGEGPQVTAMDAATPLKAHCPGHRQLLQKHTLECPDPYQLGRDGGGPAVAALGGGTAEEAWDLAWDLGRIKASRGPDTTSQRSETMEISPRCLPLPSLFQRAW